MPKTHARNTRFLVRVAVALVIAGTGAATFVRILATESRADVPIQSAGHLQPHPPEHRVPTIDGAITPTLIPDETAYRLFLRMAAHPDVSASRAYIKFIFAPGGDDNAGSLDDATVGRLSTIVSEHASRLRSIEQSNTAVTQTDALQQGRSEILASFRAQMAGGLGPGGVQRLQDVIEARVKPKIRVFNKP